MRVGSSHWPVRGSLLFAILACGAGMVRAQVTTWSGTGDWSSAVNWSAGVPISTSNAAISTGTVTVSDTRAVNLLTFSGGTLNGTGTLNVGGLLTVSGATPLSGSGILNANGGLALTGQVNVSGGQTLNLAGTSTWSSGTLYYGFGSGTATALNNAGTFTLTGNNDITNYGGGAQLVVNNSGTFAKNGGTGTSTIDTTFNNTGTVSVQTGTLSFTGGGSVSSGALSGGTWRVSDGARLNLDSDTAITRNFATVVLTGTGSVFNGLSSLTRNDGTLQLRGGRNFAAGAPFTNAGVLDLGSGSVLSVAGNLSLLSQSQLLLTLAGATNGAGYNVINATGAMALGGTLQLTLDSGFNPVSGASFTLFQASGFSGSFTSVALPGNYIWNTSLLATQGVVSVVSAIPEPSTYAALAGLAALCAVVWRRRNRRVPV